MKDFVGYQCYGVTNYLVHTNTSPPHVIVIFSSATILTSNSDKLHDFIVSTLIRRGIDQCNNAMQRLSKERRANKNSLTEEELKQTGEVATDARDLNVSSLIVDVNRVDNDVTALQKEVKHSLEAAIERYCSWDEGTPFPSRATKNEAARRPTEKRTDAMQDGDHQHATTRKATTSKRTEKLAPRQDFEETEFEHSGSKPNESTTTRGGETHQSSKRKVDEKTTQSFSDPHQREVFNAERNQPVSNGTTLQAPQQTFVSTENEPESALPSLSPAYLEVGRLVDVEARTWPGINKQGGIGRIIKVHTQVATRLNGGGLAEKVTHVDVKYVVNTGREKMVAVQYVKSAQEVENEAEGKELRDRSLLMGRCTNCPSLRKDCGACDWAIVEKTNVKEKKSAEAEVGKLKQKDYDMFMDSEEEDAFMADIERRYNKHNRALSRKRGGRTTHQCAQRAKRITDVLDSESDGEDETLANLERKKATETRKRKRLRRRATSALESLPTGDASISLQQKNKDKKRLNDFGGKHLEKPSAAKDRGHVDRDSTSEVSKTAEDDQMFEVQNEGGDVMDTSNQEMLLTPREMDPQEQEVLLTPREIDSDVQKADDISFHGDPDDSSGDDSSVKRIADEDSSDRSEIDCDNDFVYDEDWLDEADSNFVQGEGDDEEYALPRDMMDRTKLLRYAELPQFIDSVASTIEEGDIPRVRNKLSNLKSRLMLTKMDANTVNGDNCESRNKFASLMDEW